MWVVGLRRSKHPAKERGSSEPLRPFTVPNLISLIRLLLIPVFLVLAFRSKSGVSSNAIIVFGVAAFSDFIDGLLARLLGQYSRLGVLMDPLVDRLLVISGMIVTWHFELLPRWAIALVVAREAFMLLVSRYAISKGLKIEVNWIGRLSLWMIMVGVGLAMIHASNVSDAIFIAGVFLSIAATGKYLIDGKGRLDEGKQN